MFHVKRHFPAKRSKIGKNTPKIACGARLASKNQEKASKTGGKAPQNEQKARRPKRRPAEWVKGVKNRGGRQPSSKGAAGRTSGGGSVGARWSRVSEGGTQKGTEEGKRAEKGQKKGEKGFGKGRRGRGKRAGREVQLSRGDRKRGQGFTLGEILYFCGFSR